MALVIDSKNTTIRSSGDPFLDGDIFIEAIGSGSINLDGAVNVTGPLVVAGLSYPDGVAATAAVQGQHLVLGANNTLKFVNPAAANGGIGELADDLTPRLGGDLNLDGKRIKSGSNSFGITLDAAAAQEGSKVIVATGERMLILSDYDVTPQSPVSYRIEKGDPGSLTLAATDGTVRFEPSALKPVEIAGSGYLSAADNQNLWLQAPNASVLLGGTSDLGTTTNVAALGRFEVFNSLATDPLFVVDATEDKASLDTSTVVIQETEYSLATTNVTVVGPTEVWTQAVAAGETFLIVVTSSIRDVTTGDTLVTSIRGAVKNHAGTVTLIGSEIQERWADTAANAWDIDLVVDDTANTVGLAVTGEAGRTLLVSNNIMVERI